MTAVPQTRVSLLPTVCDESLAVNGSVAGKWAWKGKTREEKKRGRGCSCLVSQSCHSTVNSFQDSKGWDGGKKGLLNFYGTDTNTSSVPRRMKRFVKILQVKMCAREFWDCLIFMYIEERWVMPSCSQWYGVVWRVASTRKREKEEQKKRCLKMRRTLSLADWWLQGVFEGCRSTDVKAW